MIKIFLIIFLASACVWYVLWLADTEMKEASCFDVLLEGGYNKSQKYDGFSVLTSDYTDCPPLIHIPFLSDEKGKQEERFWGRWGRSKEHVSKETYLTILPKARGTVKLKYSFRDKVKDFTVKKEVYDRIKATILISREVDEFLAAHVAE